MRPARCCGSSDLTKRFKVRRAGLGGSAGGFKVAVDDVSFDIQRGECLGLVGESGCGKTTLSKLIMRALSPDSGQVMFNDRGKVVDVLALKDGALMEFRRKIQFMFQDPFGSLNPRMTVLDIVSEPLAIHKVGDHATRIERVKELMQLVGLNVRDLKRYPHSFSGGQRQRIGIARALALKPDLLICDEPVSALDVSIQAQVLNLLKDLQEKLGLTYLFISHNLAVVDYIADRIMVMCAGQIVEIAPCGVLFANPLHPYTKALLTAVPEPNPDYRLAFDKLMEEKASQPGAWPAPFTVNESREAEPDRHGRRSLRARQQGAGGGMRGRAIRYLALPLLALALLSSAARADDPAYPEVPYFADDVAKGDVPPIAQRLPEHPAVAQFQWQGQVPGKYSKELDMLMSSAKDTRYMVIYGYARLVGYDAKYNLVPDILESFDVQEGRIFTFHLRKGHKWSDGSPFTTEDFRYYWEDVANNKDLSPVGPPRELLVDGEPPKVEIIDETTIRYTWSKPNSEFLPALARADCLFIFRPSKYLKQFHIKYADKDKLAAAVKDAGSRNWAALHNKRDNQNRDDNPKLPTLDPWIPQDQAACRPLCLRAQPLLLPGR